MSTIDAGAFSAIYERHHDAIRGYLRARVRDDALADDLTAETFARAFASHDRFVDQGHGERPWLFTIATNLLRDELRAGTRRQALLDRLPADGHTPPPEPAGPADPLLAGALRDLRREELEVLLLSAWADLSYEEIAAALDVPVGTVRSRLHRARRHLRTALAAGIAAGVALVAILALLPTRDGRGPGVPGTPLRGPVSAAAACAEPGPAGRCLRAVGLLAGLQTLPGSGDVLYERGSTTLASFLVGGPPREDRGNQIPLATARTPFSVSRWVVEERWVAADGSGRFAATGVSRVRLDSARDRAAWRAAGSPDLERLIPQVPPPDPASSAFPAGAAGTALLGANGLNDELAGDDPLRGLSEDPTVLAGQLREKAWSGRDAGDGGCPSAAALSDCPPAVRDEVRRTASGFAITLLGYPAAGPRLRAALVEVLRRTPRTRGLGLRRLPDGTGVAVIRLDRAWAADGLDVLAFDPSTGALRGTGTTGEDDTLRWFATTNDVRARVPAVGRRP